MRRAYCQKLVGFLHGAPGIFARPMERFLNRLFDSIIEPLLMERIPVRVVNQKTKRHKQGVLNQHPAIPERRSLFESGRYACAPLSKDSEHYH